MNKLTNLYYAIDGKKTYIIAVIMAVLNLAVACNWISPANLSQINTVLVALGLGALRSGINKV